MLPKTGSFYGVRGENPNLGTWVAVAVVVQRIDWVWGCLTHTSFTKRPEARSTGLALERAWSVDTQAIGAGAGIPALVDVCSGRRWAMKITVWMSCYWNNVHMHGGMGLRPNMPIYTNTATNWAQLSHTVVLFLASATGKSMRFVTGLHINLWQQTNRSG